MRKQLPILFDVQKNLGPLENKILNIIWSKDCSTVREVISLLQETRPFAYTTVMTVMDHLYKKGFLGREKVKKTYYYFPVVKKNVLTCLAVRKTLNYLIKEYGIKRFLFSLIYPLQIPFPSLSLGLIANFKIPAMAGFCFALFFGLFSFSIWDLMQNMQFLGMTDYLKLVLSEPKILQSETNLVLAAFFESLPAVNLITSLVLFGLTGFLLKQLAKLLDFKVFLKFGELA